MGGAMSKLIERLDQLESYVYYCDGVDGTSHKNAYSPCDDIRFKEVLGDAYPKLRAVVEAAQLLAGDGVVDDGMYIVESRFRDRVKQALAALEES
jgi:hypothetical protein